MADYTIRAGLATARAKGGAVASRFVSLAGAFAARPRLLASIAIGLLAGLALSVVPNPLRSTTRIIVAWDAGCIAFLAAVLHTMFDCPMHRLRAVAARQDEGQGMILGLTLLAAAASLVALVAELSAAKGGKGVIAELRIGLAFGTVVLSWLVVQFIFALHYAHEFYAPGVDQQRGGLAFPGDEAPDYWDFLHFSLVIGVAAQTADIAFTSKALRRIGTVHSLVAFAFNTLVLALSINLAASLFG
jgi:uncharacterized membrane protein